MSSTWENAVQWLRDQPGNDALIRAAYYDDPLLEAADRYWQSNEWAAVRAFLPHAPADALDVGAGRGIASYALARDGHRVTALEPDKSGLVGAGAIRALATEAGLPISVVDQLTDPLPFPDAAFDVVFARAVLHHIPDLPSAMRDFYRILKPGGVLIAIREHVLSKDADRDAFLDTHPLHHRYGGENAFRLEVYTAAMTDAGFQIDQIMKPLGSAINYGPQSKADLLNGLANRVAPIPAFVPLLGRLLNTPVMDDFTLWLAGRFDERPGRHFSFVARRPC